MISVVIPTKESGGTIANCLSSMRECQFSELETIVVDDFSHDETANIARRFGAIVLSLRSTMTEARNAGTSASSGEFILQLDSDMELTTGVLEECRDMIKVYDALVIPEMSYGEGYWAKCKSLERSMYIGLQDMEAARFFRREVLSAIGGYDVTLVAGEDRDVTLRLREVGSTIGRTTLPIRHNEGRLSLTRAAMRKARYARSAASYQRKHPVEFAKQVSLDWRLSILRRNWKAISKRPWLAPGLVLMKLAELVAFTSQL